jgi:hypothetical protein
MKITGRDGRFLYCKLNLWPVALLGFFGFSFRYAAEVQL